MYIDATKTFSAAYSLNQLMSGTPSDSLVSIGVVQEVIFDPADFILNSEYELVVDKPHLLADLPANSLLVRVLTGKEFNTTAKLRMCLPMFPSHLQMPIKVGEQVFIFQIGKFSQ